MKKIIISLTMMLVMCSMNAFAGETNVTEKVLNAFKQDFNNASEVQWTIGDNYYKAEFAFNGLYIAAFYDTDGALYGITRHISSLDLPLHLLISLNKKIDHYWITDLFEVAKNGSTSYYITLEDADNILMLKASEGNDWSTWKKTKKS